MMSLKKRFDGLLPVVIDLETGGCNSATDALLEIAAQLVEYNELSQLVPAAIYACHVEPFVGSRLDPAALEVTGIDPYHPFRFAISELKALQQLFDFIWQAVNKYDCRRAILVGHNAHFDLAFIQAAAKRCKYTRENPLHSFTCFDTATLSGLIYGKTVLAKAVKASGMDFDQNEAHSAIYDVKCTAELFCKIVNLFPRPQICKVRNNTKV